MVLRFRESVGKSHGAVVFLAGIGLPFWISIHTTFCYEDKLQGGIKQENESQDVVRQEEGCQRVMNQDWEIQRRDEGRKLYQAVEALVQEKKAVDVMDIGLDIYWMDIGNKKHPLYGFCPSGWKDQGRITSIVLDQEGKLREIVYEAPDGKGEIWKILMEDNELMVEVVEN